MTRTRRVILCVWLSFLGGSAAQSPPSSAALDQAFVALRTYNWGQSREPLNAIEDALHASPTDAAQRRQLEDRLAALLTTDAPAAAKLFACNRLSLIGSAHSVPVLAELLANPDLSHPARLALERIGGTEASDALRTALPKVEGKLKAGIINSLGALANANAAQLLRDSLGDKDPVVAHAAVAALSRIGTTEAVQALEQFRIKAPRPLDSLVADALLGTAQRFLEQGKPTEAARIFHQLYTPEALDSVRRMSFKGLLAAEPQSATPVLSRALAGTNATECALAARVIAQTSEGPGLQPFVDASSGYPAAGKIAVLEACQVRHEPAGHTIALDALRGSAPDVRFAALRALGALGNTDDVPALARMLTAASSEESTAAESALRAIAARAGPHSVDAILASLKDANARTRVVLLRVLGSAGGAQALDALRNAIHSGSPSAQQAALRVLAEWPDAAAAPDLLQLAQEEQNLNRRLLAFRGYVRMCILGQRPLAEKEQLLTEGLSLAQTAAQKRLVVAALGDLRDPELVKVLVPFLADSNLAPVASVAIVNLAATISDRAAHTDLAPALEKVVQLSTSPIVTDQAGKVLERVKAKAP